jgi:hypothetical protein
MTRRLATTYSMLCQNGRTPPALQPPPQPELPQPDADFELPDFNFDDFDDSQFNEWNEPFIEDAEAEAEKAAQ